MASLRYTGPHTEGVDLEWEGVALHANRNGVVQRVAVDGSFEPYDAPKSLVESLKDRPDFDTGPKARKPSKKSTPRKSAAKSAPAHTSTPAEPDNTHEETNP